MSNHPNKPANHARLGEIPLKLWLHNEAEKHAVTPLAIFHRLKRRPEKYYPNIKLRRVNQRVVFVKAQPTPTQSAQAPTQDPSSAVQEPAHGDQPRRRAQET